MGSLEELVEYLKRNERIKDDLILKAFEKIDRKDFVPEVYESEAYEDKALPIEYDATISQPSTVAFMLEKLGPKKGEKILEIGTGSGYVSALLAYTVGDSGKIYSIEYVPQINEIAKKNLEKYLFNNIKLFVKDGKEGLEEFFPFDKIISGAYARKIPERWKEQLILGGKIVSPFDNSIIVLKKVSEKEFKEEVFPGYAFVELK